MQGNPMSPKLMEACSDSNLFGLAEKCYEITEGDCFGVRRVTLKTVTGK